MRHVRPLSLIAALFLSAFVAFGQDAPPPQGGGDAPAAQPGGNRGNRGGNRGGFDPAAMQQRMLDMIKEQLKASSDEWTVIEPRLKTVMEKQRATRGNGMRGLFPRRGNNDQQPEVDPETAAVEKAIDSQDAAQIKSALDAFRKAKTDKEADLAKAKDALKEVLSVGQEARLVIMGILD